MKIDINQSINSQEIDSLEEYLLNFQEEWELTQAVRSSRWRKYFVICFMLTILLSMIAPKFFWIGLIVIAYFAGSLFTQLRQNAKTTHQIMEHKRQLRLARLLSSFETSPCSHK